MLIATAREISIIYIVFRWFHWPEHQNPAKRRVNRTLNFSKNKNCQNEDFIIPGIFYFLPVVDKFFNRIGGKSLILYLSLQWRLAKFHWLRRFRAQGQNIKNIVWGKCNTFKGRNWTCPLDAITKINGLRDQFFRIPWKISNKIDYP